MIGAIFAIGASGMFLERVRPGSKLPSVRTWPIRVGAATVVQLGLVVLAGLTWEHWLQGVSLFELGASVPAGYGGPVAYLLGTFVFYWWHRWRHESETLWRLFHQIHHSPRRIELVTSIYKHPVEMIANSVIGTVICYPLLGLDAAGGAMFTFCCVTGGFFYHTNISTPHWLGYLFQRPEMHRIHHQHERHRNNYSDLPLWDMLFGTYENPSGRDVRCGFDPEREERVGEMLQWNDVHAEDR
jgi:sterol desaturase/sphingolipid hydroxylase (fatty acid hydroxylase superfamily)